MDGIRERFGSLIFFRPAHRLPEPDFSHPVKVFAGTGAIIRRQSRLWRAERASVLCGVPICTFRRVLEYFAESTNPDSARRPPAFCKEMSGNGDAAATSGRRGMAQEKDSRTERQATGMPVPPEHGDKGKRGKKNYDFPQRQRKRQGKKIPRTLLQQAVRGCRQVIPFPLSPGA